MKFILGDVIRLDAEGYTYTGCLAEVIEIKDNHYELELIKATENAINQGRDVGYTTSVRSDSIVITLATYMYNAQTLEEAPEIPNFKLIHDFNSLLGGTT